MHRCLLSATKPANSGDSTLLIKTSHRISNPTSVPKKHSVKAGLRRLAREAGYMLIMPALVAGDVYFVSDVAPAFCAYVKRKPKLDFSLSMLDKTITNAAIAALVASLLIYLWKETTDIYYGRREID